MRKNIMLATCIASAIALGGCASSTDKDVATMSEAVESVDLGENQVYVDEAEGLVNKLYEDGAYLSLVISDNPSENVIFIYNKNKMAYAETGTGCPIWYDNSGNARRFEVPYVDMKDVSPVTLSENAIKMAKAGEAEVSHKEISLAEQYETILEQIKESRAAEETTAEEVDVAEIGDETTAETEESAVEESTVEESTVEESTETEAVETEASETEAEAEVEETMSAEEEAAYVLGYTPDEVEDGTYNETTILVKGRDNIVKLYNYTMGKDDAEEYVADLFSGDEDASDDKMEFIFHTSPDYKYAGIMCNLYNDDISCGIAWYFDGYIALGGDWEALPENWMSEEKETEEIKADMEGITAQLAERLKKFEEEHFTPEQIAAMDEEMAKNSSVEETTEAETEASSVVGEEPQDELDSIIRNGSFKETIDELLKADGLENADVSSFEIPEGYSDEDKAKMVDIYNKLIEWDATQQDGTLISPISPDELEFASEYISACEEAYASDTTTNAEANDKYGTIYWKDTVGIFINAIE